MQKNNESKDCKNIEGYYRYPCISGNQVVFVCEDDLWAVSKSGGIARRLTANQGRALFPRISPDGKWIVFSGNEEGAGEIFLIPSHGGQIKRMTYLGANCLPLCWNPDSTEFYFSSGFETMRDQGIYKLSLNGGQPEKLPVGYANRFNYAKNSIAQIGDKDSNPPEKIIIGRHVTDPAKWKRYRGGTAGEIWIKNGKNKKFSRILKGFKTNIASPMWINQKIYFISDHEGIGNIYSCTPEGKDIKRETSSNEYYVRNAETDGKSIIYQAGGDLFILDIEDTFKESEIKGKNGLFRKTKEKRIKIDFFSPKTQLNRKFIDTANYLQGFDLHPNGTHTVITSRGKMFSFANWDGPVTQHGKTDGIRYRLPTWLYDGINFIAISDEIKNEDKFLLVNKETGKEKIFDKFEIGKVHTILASPVENKVVFVNHKNELNLFDIDREKIDILDKSNILRPSGLSFSNDGSWIAYNFYNTAQTSVIKIADIKNGKNMQVTPTKGMDHSPSFSPDGKYLYFVGDKEFTPVMDTLKFDYGFVKSSRLYAIALKSKYDSPFKVLPKAPFDEPAKEKSKGKDQKKENIQLKTNEDKSKQADLPEKVTIDFEGIYGRIIGFPMDAGIYTNLSCYEKNIFFMEYLEDCLDHDDSSFSNEPPARNNLKYFDLGSAKTETCVESITDYKLSLKKGNMIIRSGNNLQVLKTGAKPEKEPKKEFSIYDGKIDLKRAKVGFLPLEEWKQIYREAWLLQKEHFWTENMSNIDWNRVYKRYEALLPRIGCRSELSDLIWEMQGELGTSHCYEIGGDYKPAPKFSLGKLGCRFELSEDGKSYSIKNILEGDPFLNGEQSPLIAPGINIKKGDLILAVDGQKVSKDIPPAELLINKANADVRLTIQSPGSSNTKEFTVHTLSSEDSLIYRNWVETNKNYVHKKGKNRIGYIHIPDMGRNGYAEFFRHFIYESVYDALLVDVRYNQGGHVSQLLLEQLNKKVIGYDITRWSTPPEKYPVYAVPGPIVALTNEFAGSDGDIFSHSFKLMKIGKLIGKRTWGGVVGINGQYSSTDGTVTTQPEYSFWFVDVGWGVENYGTDPDIEVDILPEDYEKKMDPQLDCAIDFLLDELKKNPPKKPAFDKRPDLSLPKLPD